MLDALKKDAFSFEGIYQDTYGRDKPRFNLDQMRAAADHGRKGGAA